MSSLAICIPFTTGFPPFVSYLELWWRNCRVRFSLGFCSWHKVNVVSCHPCSTVCIHLPYRLQLIQYLCDRSLLNSSTRTLYAFRLNIPLGFDHLRSLFGQLDILTRPLSEEQFLIKTPEGSLSTMYRGCCNFSQILKLQSKFLWVSSVCSWTCLQLWRIRSVQRTLSRWIFQRNFVSRSIHA